jgi:hypothetical protein
MTRAGQPSARQRRALMAPMSAWRRDASETSNMEVSIGEAIPFAAARLRNERSNCLDFVHDTDSLLIGPTNVYRVIHKK